MGEMTNATEEQLQAEIDRSVDESLGIALKELSAPIAGVLKFFKFMHLPPHLRAWSRLYAGLAVQVARGSSYPETTVALRKLLESKDAAVRAVLP